MRRSSSHVYQNKTKLNMSALAVEWLKLASLFVLILGCMYSAFLKFSLTKSAVVREITPNFDVCKSFSDEKSRVCRATVVDATQKANLKCNRYIEKYFKCKNKESRSKCGIEKNNVDGCVLAIVEGALQESMS